MSISTSIYHRTYQLDVAFIKVPSLAHSFFLIHINDISNSTTENILSFADDTTVFLSDADLASLFNRANSSLVLCE